MKRMFLIILAFPGITLAGEQLDLRTPTLAAEATFHVLNAVDMGQSLHIAKTRDCGTAFAYREVNPVTRAIVGEYPNEASVVASSIAYSLAYHYGSRWLQRKTEGAFAEGRGSRGAWYVGYWVFHGAMLAAKASAVSSNHHIGLRVGGSSCYAR
jgi:hypothetical protein